jgi:hypothetical protein
MISEISSLNSLDKKEKKHINDKMKSELQIGFSELFDELKKQTNIEIKDLKPSFNYQNNDHWEIFCELILKY